MATQQVRADELRKGDVLWMRTVAGTHPVAPYQSEVVFLNHAPALVPSDALLTVERPARKVTVNADDLAVMCSYSIQVRATERPTTSEFEAARLRLRAALEES